jgi:hypothetical protein
MPWHRIKGQVLAKPLKYVSAVVPEINWESYQDAYILATVLGHPTATQESLSQALYIYDTVRRPMALQVMEKSRTNGHYLQFHGKALDFDNLDKESQLFKLKKFGVAVAQNWDWAWTTSVDESIEAALRMLESWHFWFDWFSAFDFSLLLWCRQMICTFLVLAHFHVFWQKKLT